MNKAVVMGIDPSLAATGIALPDGTLRTITYTPKSLKGDIRLKYIFEEILAAVGEFGVTHAIMEDLPTHAKSAGLTGRAQGVVRLALVMTGVPYVAVVPSTMKKFATGSGNADKSDLRMELYKRTGIDNKDDNQVDAFWLRQMGIHQLGGDDYLELPKTHTASLEKVLWTEAFGAKPEAQK